MPNAGGHAEAVTACPEVTLDSLTHEDLAADVSAALASAGSALAARVEEGGRLELYSDSVDFEIESRLVAVDLLGFSSDPAGSQRPASTWRVEAGEALSTVGVLPDNVTFAVSMHQSNPNDDPGSNSEFLPEDRNGDEVRQGVITLYRADTLDNETLEDLLEDLDVALIRGGFREITSEIQDGLLVLTSAHAFEVEEGENLHILEPGRARLLLRRSAFRRPGASSSRPDHRCHGGRGRNYRVPPRSGRRNRERACDHSDGVVTGDIVEVTDLAVDLNGLLEGLSLPHEVWVEAVDGALVWMSSASFEIKYSSENESLLGLNDLPNEET